MVISWFLQPYIPPFVFLSVAVCFQFIKYLLLIIYVCIRAEDGNFNIASIHHPDLEVTRTY